ncbi:MAG: flagellar basal body P-ring formation chaperone FlgA [Mariprofundaceae bacterium]
MLTALRQLIALSTLLLIAGSAWGNELESSLQNFLNPGIHHQGADMELVRVVRWPDTKQAVRWRLSSIQRHPRQISLIAEYGHGQQQRRWYVPIQVRWWAKVVTSRQELPSRTLLQPSMLQLKRKDITAHAGAWWTNISDLKGMRSMRPMHKGDAIYSNTVMRPPLIKRGDIVTIIAGNANFSVRSQGQAMKAAGLGESILVQNMRSKKRIQAIVIDSHTVQVDL